MLLGADYSQLEIRVAACQWPDPLLIETLKEGDVHHEVARRIFGTDQITKEQRVRAKNCVFGWIYGSGGEQITQQIGRLLPHLTEAQVRLLVTDTLNRLNETYPIFVTLQQETLQSIRTTGEVTDLCGWKVQVDTANKHEVRAAINRLVQGPAARLTGLARTKLVGLSNQERRSPETGRESVKGRSLTKPNVKVQPDGPGGSRFVVILDIHDQLILDVQDEHVEAVKKLVKDAMENPPVQEVYGWSLKVPLKVDIRTGHHLGEL